MDDSWRSTYDWQADCAALIRAVDPTCSRPVYLLDRDEPGVAAVFDPRRSHANGCTGIYFADRFRALLERQGEWQGPGFVAVLDVARIERPILVQGIVLHEFVHDIEQRELADRVRNGRCAPLTRTFYELVIRPDVPVPTALKSDHSQIREHAGRFLRLALHCAHRARQQGWWGDCWEIIDPQAYYLAWHGAYARELGDEPARLADLPLTEVDRLNPPAGYQRFADEDLDRALRRLDDETEHVRKLSVEDAAADIDHTADGEPLDIDSFVMALR